MVEPTPRPAAVDRFIATVALISRAGGVVAVGLLLAAVLVICQMVVMRYVLRLPATWQHEFVTFSLIGATFIGSPYVLLTGGHVNVDLVPYYLGARGRLVLAAVALLVSLAFCATLAWQGFHFWHESLVKNWRSEGVWRAPLWVPYLSVPLGMGLLSLQLLAQLAALVSGRTAFEVDRDPPA